MNIYKSKLFPYIMGESLLGKSVTLTMKCLSVEMLPGGKGKEEEKYLLYFDETDKALILNKTNAKTIAALYGPETDSWGGNRITIHPEQVRAFGNNHTVVRVDDKRPAPAATNGKGKTDTKKPEPAPEPAAPVSQEPLFPEEAEPETAPNNYAE